MFKSDLLPIAAATALTTAVIELPISQFYSTVPSTGTAKRMAIAGAMAFAAALIGGASYRAIRKQIRRRR